MASVGDDRVAVELAKVVLDTHVLASGETAVANDVSSDLLESANSELHVGGRTPKTKVSDESESELSSDVIVHEVPPEDEQWSHLLLVGED